MFYIYADGQLLYDPLNDAHILASPKLTLELGKAGSLTFGLPPGNALYGNLRKLKTLVTVETDAGEIFRGRVLSQERDFYNIQKVYCEGDLSYLVDSVQSPEAFSGTTHELFTQIVSAHNARVEPEKRFKIGAIGIEDRPIVLMGTSDVAKTSDYEQIAINAIVNEWKTSYDYISDCLLDTCGGYLRTRRETDGVYLDYILDHNSTASQEIEFGVNMLDLTEEASAEELFTVLIPLGDDNLTVANVNGGSDELVDEEAAAIYGRVLKTHVFQNVTEPQTLLENGQRYLKSHANVPVTINIRAVDMHLVNAEIREIRVGDRVRVKSAPHNLMEYLTCTAIEYDPETPANTAYTFGNPKPTLTERYRQDIRKAEETAVRSGARGGGKAAEVADTTAKDDLGMFYDQWIQAPDGTATVSLGALTKQFKDAEEVLAQAGIDISGVSGNVNIRSLKNDLDETGKKLASQSARIDLLQADGESRISMLVGRTDYLEDQATTHAAEFTMRANELESAIEMKADRVDVDAIRINLRATDTSLDELTNVLKNEVGIKMDGKGGNLNLFAMQSQIDAAGEATEKNSARLTALSNDTESSLSLVTRRTTELGEKTAKLELRTTNMESEISAQADKINLKADTVTLNSRVTAINSEILEINTELLTVKKLVADEVNALKANVSWLKTKSVEVSRLTADIVNVGSYLMVPDIRMNNQKVATENWVNSTLNAKGYLTSLPDYIRVSSLSATDNMYFGGWTVATQKWVTEQLAAYAKADHGHSWGSVTGKPSTYPPQSHRHSFSGSTSLSWGHAHTTSSSFKAGKNTGGVVNYSIKTVSISGSTGYN